MSLMLMYTRLFYFKTMMSIILITFPKSPHNSEIPIHFKLSTVPIYTSIPSPSPSHPIPPSHPISPPPHPIPRVVNPDGWISSALDALVRAYPPHKPMAFEGGEEKEGPYWLINLGIGGVGPAPWDQCLGYTLSLHLYPQHPQPSPVPSSFFFFVGIIPIHLFCYQHSM